MANIIESPTWESGIYQLEETDIVVAGPEGVANAQAKQLANRTTWLKSKMGTVGEVSITTVDNNITLAAVDLLFKYLILDVTVNAREVTLNASALPVGAIISLQAISTSVGNHLRVKNAAILTRAGVVSEVSLYAGESLELVKYDAGLILRGTESNFYDAGELKQQPVAPAVHSILANGALYNRQAYWRLFKKIESIAIADSAWVSNSANTGSYSLGNGSTTFRVPDLRGVFLRGLDGGRALDPGRSSGTLQTSENKKHKHGTRDRYYAEGNFSGIPNKELMPTNYNNRFGGGDSDTDNTHWYYFDTETAEIGGDESRPVNVAYPIYIIY